MTSSTLLTLSKHYAISASRLFVLLSSPRYLEDWFSPDESIKVKVLEHDFFVGGLYNIEYSLPNAETVELHGEFITIDEPNEISFTWQWQKPDKHAGINSRVSWKLQESNNKTTLTVIHQATNDEFYQRHLLGWTGSLERLDTVVKK